MATPLAGKDGSFWSQTTGSSLLSNTDFTTGVSNWTNGTSKTTGAYRGDYCAIVTAETMSQTGACSPTDYVVLSCMAKAAADATGPATLKLNFQDPTGTSLLSGSDTISSGANTWTRYSVIRLAPASADVVHAEIKAGGGNSVYIDDVQCFKLEQIGGFSSWSLDYQYDTHDTTSFENNGWKTYLDGLKGWTASAKQYWCSEDGKRMFQHMTGQDAIYCAFYVSQDSDMTGQRLEGLAHISGVGVNTAVDAVVTSDITMQGTRDLRYIAD